MNTVLLICREEWRYWLRSRLSGTALAIMALVLASSTVYTWSHTGLETQRRENLQAQAEQAFLDQPARHPHRMVHYGHYAFRAPVPMAALDPGIDPYAGMVIFLEGHRQNSAMFAEAGELASLSRFGSLSPAFALQALAPLLLLILGFSTVSRERERGTLVQLQASGVGGSVLLAGKALALLSVAALLLAPLVLAGVALASGGAGIPALAAMVGVYALYLGAWAVGITAVSAFTRSAAATLALLLLAWVVLAIAVPRFAATAARALEPMPGQLESELTMLTAENELSDGHNVADADPLIAQLLDLHGVDDVAELPVNIRGLVSTQAEASLTDTMNAYAGQRLAAEQRQARRLDDFALLSPLLAIRRASMALAGTDLEHQHRFLREAEQLRFDFVQGLNALHANELDYNEDIRRSSDPLAEQSTRIAATNWQQLLKDFRFEADPLAERMARATPMALVLGAWLLAMLALAWLALRRLER